MQYDGKMKYIDKTYFLYSNLSVARSVLYMFVFELIFTFLFSYVIFFKYGKKGLTRMYICVFLLIISNNMAKTAQWSN